MDKTIFSILLNRKNKVLINENDLHSDTEQSVVTDKDKCIVATMNKNLEPLGYTMSEGLFNLFMKMESDQRNRIYLCLISDIKEMIGANKEYNPMYPNFPKSVMERSDVELYINAMVHYWSCGELIPYEEKAERLPLFNTAKVEVLNAGCISDVKDIFINLCLSKTSLSKNDLDDMKVIAQSISVCISVCNDLPEQIPFKENAAYITKLFLDMNMCMSKYMNTATDVLRLITAMSDGDISLASNTRYRNLTRRERRCIMYMLSKCHNLAEDLTRYKNKWIRIGEILHPSEFIKNDEYSKVVEAFHIIRNDGGVQSFASKIDEAIADKNIKYAIELLTSRPGEFARRINHLLCKFTEDKDRSRIISAFAKIACRVSSTVLLQLRECYINKLNKSSDMRVFFPKGNLAKAYYIIDPKTESIPEKYMEMVISICELALMNIYNNREYLGKVYVSEDLKKYTVPFSQRSASKTMMNVSRGSRISVPEDTNVIRSFIWWTNNGHNSIDVDLSAAIFDENWKFINRISYMNVRDGNIEAYHSGDLIDGGPENGKGSAEFIDININKAISAGARYVVFNVYNYSGLAFGKMKHAMFGWMNREDAECGEIFEASTVQQKMDLSIMSTISIPVIFDLQEREYIWCDMSLDINTVSSSFGGINVESNMPSVIATCKAMTDMQKPNLYDLFMLNGKGRGLIVENKEDADITFGLDREEYNVTPYDIDTIVGEYL